MPEATDISLPSKPETAKLGGENGSQARGETLAKGDYLWQIGAQTNRLLTERASDSRTIKGVWAYAAEEMDARGQSSERFDRHNTETHLALLDKRTNTSFIINTHNPDNYCGRYVTVKFQPLGENKGSLGGGTIRLEYEDGKEQPIAIRTSKADNIHMRQVSDDEWSTANTAIYGAGYFDPQLKRTYTEFSDVDVAEILSRLSSSQLETDATLTERAAMFQDMNHRFTHARAMLDITRQNGSSQDAIAQAENAWQQVKSEWETWTGLHKAPAKEEQKEPGADAQEKDQQDTASTQDDRDNTLRRGIVTQEILDDPNYQKIREEVRARMLLQARKQIGSLAVTVLEDEVDKEVVSKYGALAAKRAELEKLAA